MLGKLNRISIKPKESIRRYVQHVKSLLNKLATEVPKALQVEWYLSGLPSNMAFHVRHTKPTTLPDAMETVQNYENS